MSKLGKFAAACVAVLCAFGAEARLTARYTFDDIGRNGANMLKASVGQDIIFNIIRQE